MPTHEHDSDLARDIVEFSPGELRFDGSDYGIARFEGTTPDARAAFDTITVAAGRRGSRVVVDLRVTLYDGPQDLVETRHAGLEGTTRLEPTADELQQPAGE